MCHTRPRYLTLRDLQTTFKLSYLGCGPTGQSCADNMAFTSYETASQTKKEYPIHQVGSQSSYAEWQMSRCVTQLVSEHLQAHCRLGDVDLKMQKEWCC